MLHPAAYIATVELQDSIPSAPTSAVPNGEDQKSVGLCQVAEYLARTIPLSVSILGPSQASWIRCLDDQDEDNIFVGICLPSPILLSGI